MKKGDLKIGDKNYPLLLKEVKSPPKSLKYKGDFNNDFLKYAVAVVGSRKITNYGRSALEKLVSEIARAGITVVSGFMYGVDALAHQSAIDNGAKTVAVLPCGVDVVHPSYQRKLYQSVLKNGFFLSEYEDSALPAKWTYPKRNRIVVGITKALLVIEAKEKSGSMISADFAKKYNRKIFAVPGSIFSSTSKGTNKLIKEGATAVDSGDEIISFLGKKIDKNDKNTDFLEKDEQDVLSVIKKRPIEADQIARILKRSSFDVSSALSSLEIKGLVKKNGRLYFSI